MLKPQEDLLSVRLPSRPRIIAEESIVAPLKPVVRVATDEDREQHEYYLSKEKEAFKTCQRKIEEHGLQ